MNNLKLCTSPIQRPAARPSEQGGDHEVLGEARFGLRRSSVWFGEKLGLVKCAFVEVT